MESIGQQQALSLLAHLRRSLRACVPHVDRRLDYVEINVYVMVPEYVPAGIPVMSSR